MSELRANFDFITINVKLETVKFQVLGYFLVSKTNLIGIDQILLPSGISKANSALTSSELEIVLFGSTRTDSRSK